MENVLLSNITWSYRDTPYMRTNYSIWCIWPELSMPDVVNPEKIFQKALQSTFERPHFFYGAVAIISQKNAVAVAIKTAVAVALFCKKKQQNAEVWA